MSRRAVLFDIGKVVLDFDNGKAINALLKLAPPTGQKRGYCEVFSDEVWKGYGMGAFTDQQFRAHVRDLFFMGPQVKDEQIDHAASNVFTPIPETIAMINLLRRREDVTLVAVSNVEPVRLRSEHSAMAWELFRYTVASCRVGMMKPNPGIFRVALERAEALAEEALFVDDLKENVEAAERLGIRSHRFDLKAPHKLAAFLSSHGLPVS